MSRIDANISTQVADVVRPRQFADDSAQQLKQSQQIASQQAEQGARPVPSDDLRAAAGQLKQVIEIASGRKLSFEIDDATEAIYVTIRDMTTGDVIKQIPSKEVLALHKRMNEMIGMLIDKQA